MPGALKSRKTDCGNAVETTDCLKRMETSVKLNISHSLISGESSKQKKRRKKSRKSNSPDLESGRGFDEPLDRIVRDAVDLSSSAMRVQTAETLTEVTQQKNLREYPAGNDAETSVCVKQNKRKRKPIEEEQPLKKRKSSSVAAVAETSDAHSRVWRYVCNRAVLVNPKYVRHSDADQSVDSAQPSRYPNSTVVTEIKVSGKKIVVTSTKEGAVAQEWLNRQKGTVFGLDAEWRPSYKKGTEHKVALLQICGENECLIVQMLYLDVIPRGLVNFLKDPEIKFPGVGIKGDAVKLKRDWGLECNGTVDLTTLAATILGRPELQYTGLKALAKVVMDYDMAKPKRVTMSNWAKPVLDKVQVEYASLDAWVSYAIHQKLYQPTLSNGSE